MKGALVGETSNEELRERLDRVIKTLKHQRNLAKRRKDWNARTVYITAEDCVIQEFAELYQQEARDERNN